LSRSTGAILLFELGLLWRLVYLRYFISGLFRRNCDSDFSIHMLFTCILLLLFQRKNVEKKRKEKNGIKEKKERKKKMCE